MSLEICILASGSSGNCTIVRTEAGSILIDAGIGPRIAQQRMRGSGAKLDDVRAICLTHLDADHFRPSWARAVLERDIRVFCNSVKIEELLRRVAYLAQEDIVDAFSRQICGFTAREFEALPGVTIRPISFAHDAAGSHGFIIEFLDQKVGYATDLGRVPENLIDRFAGVDILAMESNYDPGMQLASARPWFLKQRIMGGAGHLSNQQALEAIRRIFDRAQEQQAKMPSHVVLLHRSRECNCPRLVRKLFSADPRIAQRLTLAEQYSRSQWLRPPEGKPHIGEQLMLGWV